MILDRLARFRARASLLNASQTLGGFGVDRESGIAGEAIPEALRGGRIDRDGPKFSEVPVRQGAKSATLFPRQGHLPILDLERRRNQWAYW